MSFPHGRTATRVRPLGRDRNGDPLPGDPDELDITGCAWWPTSSTETVYQQDTTTSNLTLLAPAGADILGTDQMRVDGLLYEVSGDPTEMVSPLTGATSGRLVQLTRSTG